MNSKNANLVGDSLSILPDLMAREDSDIKRVIELVERDGLVGYMIETNYKTFPKFVVGTFRWSEGCMSSVTYRSRSGSLETAADAFAEIQIEILNRPEGA